MTDLDAERLRKHLHEMIAAGIIEEIEGPDGTTLYGLSDHRRRSTGVLMAATRWERRYRPDESAAVGAQDAEIFLRVALPLVRLAESMSGTCAMTMALDPAPGAPRSLTVWARLRRGRVVAHSAGPLRSVPSASARGSVDDWLDALLDGAVDRLQIKGRRELVVALIQGIRDQLPGRQAPPEYERRAAQGRRTQRAQTGGSRQRGRPAGARALELLEQLGEDGRAILRHMEDHPGDDPDAIARAVHLDPAEVDRHLERMAELGLIRPAPPAD